MVGITLDGEACSLELPPDCVSVAQVSSLVKRELGAAYACTPTRLGIIRFEDGCLDAIRALDNGEPRHLMACLPCLRVAPAACCTTLRPGCNPPLCRFSDPDQPERKRLFLSAKSWQPDGTVSEDASLLACSTPGKGLVSADELPTSLLLRGFLKLQAFTAAHAQASTTA